MICSMFLSPEGRLPYSLLTLINDVNVELSYYMYIIDNIYTASLYSMNYCLQSSAKYDIDDSLHYFKSTMYRKALIAADSGR